MTMSLKSKLSLYCRRLLNKQDVVENIMPKNHPSIYHIKTELTPAEMLNKLTELMSNKQFLESKDKEKKKDKSQEKEK